MKLRIDIQQQLGAFTLDAQVNAGAGTTVVFGRSGSGKTSLINAIAGLSTPQNGRITLGDRVLFDAVQGINMPVHQRRIGYVFQDARLFPHLNVAQNLEFGARFASTPPSPAEHARLIEVLGISALLKRRPAALSGGEKQRVALGRALLSAPELLLLDEPLAALDEARKQEILPYLERLRAEGGPPMIYVTHDMSEIVRLADGLTVMRDGRCVVQGLAEDVLADPANMQLIGVQDAGALLRGVISHHGTDGLSTIRLSASELTVPHIDAAIGQSVRLRLRAQDVILSLSRPVGLSSQNALEAQITEIQQGSGPGVAIALHSGADRLIARITARALKQMQLSVGQKVWAIVKANALPPAAIANANGEHPKRA
ncbi:MAG: molybdenum ABC transporter ATP-binding protein [Planktotalea sp.]|uniref:molybdenum ABC transporter ATP-binding protein n=1 Tax=Planktotalea sp. TaxID=2029877 RepID=UPI003C773840